MKPQGSNDGEPFPPGLKGQAAEGSGYERRIPGNTATALPAGSQGERKGITTLTLLSSSRAPTGPLLATPPGSLEDAG